ncbi:MAG: DUF2959 domain-containing protein [Phycisphaerales bacterium]|nr:DUF2959 domain-containing protein [Phycisphaerales bacterium]
MNRSILAVLTIVLAAAVVGGAGCSSTSIALRESVLGQAKREQLVNRVSDAREAQEEAKQQFASALDEFIAVTGAGADAQVADLEARYRKLKSSYEKSESRAGAVRDRISSVERVAGALFREWEAELAQYQSAQLRQASQQQLNDTRAQYDRLVGVMKQAEGKMGPVLAAFKDQVLFLKHNLNARAIASLQGTATQVQNDVAGLIREMEASIAEADSFIRQMQPAK